MKLVLFALLMGLGHGAEVGLGAAEHMNAVNDTLAAVQVSVRPSSDVGDKAMYERHVGAAITWWLSFIVNLVYASQLGGVAHSIITDMKPSDWEQWSQSNKFAHGSTITAVLVIDLVGVIFMFLSRSENFKRMRNSVGRKIIWPIIYMVLTGIDLLYMELANANTLLDKFTPIIKKETQHMIGNKFRPMYDLEDANSLWWSWGRLIIHAVNAIMWWPTSMKKSNTTDSSLMQLGAFLQRLDQYRAGAIARFNKTKTQMVEGGDMERVKAALGSQLQASWASMETVKDKVVSSGFDASLEHAFKQVDRWVDTHGMESLLQLDGRTDFPMDDSKTDEFINSAKRIYGAISPSLQKLREGSPQFKMLKHTLPDHRLDDVMGMVRAADNDLEELQHHFKGSSQGGI